MGILPILRLGWVFPFTNKPTRKFELGRACLSATSVPQALPRFLLWEQGITEERQLVKRLIDQVPSLWGQAPGEGSCGLAQQIKHSAAGSERAADLNTVSELSPKSCLSGGSLTPVLQAGTHCLSRRNTSYRRRLRLTSGRGICRINIRGELS